MGVATQEGQVVKLVDTAKNISSILPELTSGQLASVDVIEISDNSSIDIDPSTFEKLDAATQYVKYSGHDGTAVKNDDGTLGSINIVADSLASLEKSKIVKNGKIVSQIDSVGENLLHQISTVRIRDIAPLTDGSLPTISVQEFLQYTELGAKLDSNIIIKDTTDNITSILWSEDPAVSNLYSNIAGLINIDEDSTIELSWQQFQNIGGNNITSANIFGGLVNIELSVSGTATELQAIFNTYGTSFNSLQNNISFRVTDGGEVTLNTVQAEALDGRLNGTFILQDNAEGIANALNKALPSNLKDISVIANSSAVKELTLTVDQFRGLPYFSMKIRLPLVIQKRI